MAFINKTMPGAPDKAKRQAFDRIMKEGQKEAKAGTTTAQMGWSQDAIDRAAERFNKTGEMPRNLGTREIAARTTAAIQNRAAEMAKEQGKSTDDILQDRRKYGAQAAGARKWFGSADSRSTRALGVTIDHISTMNQAVAALQNGDIQTFNKLWQAWSAQTGNPAPTNVEAVGSIVGPEIIKALGVAQAGTAGERQHAAQMWSTAKSPAQLAGASEYTKRLLAGQLDGQRRLFTTQTGLPQQIFDDILGPEAVKELEALSRERGGAATGGPAVGTVENGYRFKGGDPSKQESWEKAQ